LIGKRSSVKAAGIVAISGGGTTTDLNIAGATVGETDFRLSSASNGDVLLTKSVSSSSMAFLRPTSAAAMPAAASSLTVRPTIKAALPAITNSAAFAGPMPELLKTIPHIGLQAALIAQKMMVF
jgi:hypothetical protein